MSANSLRLSGRVALVTGAASGIGKAIAERLAAEGSAVAVTDIADEAGQAVARALQDGGAQAVYWRLDVASEPAWQQVVAEVVARFGGLDILVNNAGVHGRRQYVEDVDLDSWERDLAVLQTGVMLGMKTAAPALMKSRHASVINISSVFGIIGGFGLSPAYHAAKGAVRTLTKSVAVGWASKGIRVNSVHPGFIATPYLVAEPMSPEEKQWREQARQLMVDAAPMARLGAPEEVAAGVAFLASDDSSFMTGAELVIDGGYTAR